jgi:hypothetical protein
MIIFSLTVFFCMVTILAPEIAGLIMTGRWQWRWRR